MTQEERRENDERIDAHIHELENMAHKSPFFAELLADLKILKTRLADANHALGAVTGFVFGETYADSEGVPVTGISSKVMLYNKDVLSEEDASRILDKERFRDPRVVVLDMENARNLFPHLILEQDAQTESEDSKN